MAYSDFTLKKIKQELNINVVENINLFANVAEIAISEYLLATLNYNVPLAMAIGTEKVRSELIIAHVLLEVRKVLDNSISFFSGINLDVDKDRGLAGYCDFILSKTAEQFYLSAPIVVIVEAKSEYIAGGLGQCIAEMYAANVFNAKEGLSLPIVYGAVTTGNVWKFLQYKHNIAYIDVMEYHVVNINKIVAILVEMVN